MYNGLHKIKAAHWTLKTQENYSNFIKRIIYEDKRSIFTKIKEAGKKCWKKAWYS